MVSLNAKQFALDALAQARAAGLDKAVRSFPDDVIAAAQGAAQSGGAVTAPVDPAAEPWPPMRMKGAA